jgi:hypothetical protein
MTSTKAPPAEAAKSRYDLEEEIYQLRGLVNLLCVTAFFANTQPDFIFDLRRDVVHGVMRAVQDGCDRLYHAYHGKEA